MTFLWLDAGLRLEPPTPSPQTAVCLDVCHRLLADVPSACGFLEVPPLRCAHTHTPQDSSLSEKGRYKQVGAQEGMSWGPDPQAPPNPAGSRNPSHSLWPGASGAGGLQFLKEDVVSHSLQKRHIVGGKLDSPAEGRGRGACWSRPRFPNLCSAAQPSRAWGQRSSLNSVFLEADLETAVPCLLPSAPFVAQSLSRHF